MYNGFAKGFLVGSLIGASVVIMKPDLVKNRTKKRMLRTGKTFFRKSGDIIGDVADFFR